MTVGSVFVVDLEKELFGEYWTNSYYVTAADLPGARAIAGTIVAAERSFTLSAVTFTKHRVSTPNPNDNSYIITPLQVGGQYTSPGARLPLFNTMRVDFPAGFGRPYRKYYRGCLTEDTVSGNVITDSAFLGTVLAALDELSGTITDRSGIFLGLGVLQIPVQMRQLRRGTRRRTQPIL